MSTQPVPTDLSPQHRQLIVRRILFCPAEERTARELQSLDTSEREQVWADMTGYAPTVHYRMHEAESTPLLEDRMAKWKEQERTILQTDEEVGRQEMNPPLSQAAVSFSGIDGRVAYRMACIQDPEWVEKQKLKFLRSENFDATLAVQRMMRYLALKSYLFCVGGSTTNSSGRGDDVLGRDVRLSDLNTDDLEALKSGGVQFLSEYDAAGRGVIFTKARKYKDRKNLLRAMFYTTQHALQNENCQKVGFISLSYNVGGFPEGGYDYEIPLQMSQVGKALPIRLCGIYLCFDSSLWKPVADLVSHVLSPLLRVRLRSIQGSHQECLYQLYALGIPVSSLPLTDEGGLTLHQHHSWIEEQHRNEQHDEQRSTSTE